MIKNKVELILFDNQINKDSDPLDLPGIFILCGGVGSGKTSTILSLMRHWTKNKIFHKCIFYTPNGKYDPKLEKNLSKKVLITEDVNELKDELNDAIEQRKSCKKFRTLMILDDVCADNSLFPSCNQHTELCHRLVSVRHLGITCIITAHSFKLIPKIIRLNARFTLIWSVGSNETDCIASDLNIPKQIFEPLYYVHTSQPHSFLTYDRISKILYEKLGEKILYEGYKFSGMPKKNQKQVEPEKQETTNVRVGNSEH